MNDPVVTVQSEFSLRLEDKVSEFTLSNGMHFIILERHNAPIVSFHTFANVGAFEEEDGKTGKLPVGVLLVESEAVNECYPVLKNIYSFRSLYVELLMPSTQSINQYFKERVTRAHIEFA